METLEIGTLITRPTYRLAGLKTVGAGDDHGPALLADMGFLDGEALADDHIRCVGCNCKGGRLHIHVIASLKNLSNNFKIACTISKFGFSAVALKKRNH